MGRLHIVKTPDTWIRWRRSLAGDCGRARIVGVGTTDRLDWLFAMVTMDGPVPEIETGQDDQVS